MKKNKIIIKNKNYKVIYTKNKISLLKILIKNNIPIDYQCKEGYCGTCRIILIQGKVYYLKKYTLASLQKNEILSCCCIVDSNIKIKI
ncbi:class I ribonucleotide reductase maintenance protein YfaE [Buchnera aphidicola (Periphyllus koelreuteriae)]|uniref:class I ribonucleotide reductase maintenance protein YfaE n=1 Tax=Buchnera aphidicola TaxID=9 RepID=UPI0031B84162